MNATNLAICFSPNLFNFQSESKDDFMRIARLMKHTPILLEKSIEKRVAEKMEVRKVYHSKKSIIEMVTKFDERRNAIIKTPKTRSKEVSKRPEEVSKRPEEVSKRPEEVSKRPEEVSKRPEEVSKMRNNGKTIQDEEEELREIIDEFSDSSATVSNVFWFSHQLRDVCVCVCVCVVVIQVRNSNWYYFRDNFPNYWLYR